MKLIYSLIAVLIAVAACSPVVCGCTGPRLFQAVVWGQVTTNGGAPASRAAMSAAAVPTGVSCVRGAMYAWGSADSLGRYRISVFGTGVVDSGCVFVEARFPAQGTNPPDTILGPVRLKFGDTPPLDSLKVDIVLPR